MSHNIKIQRLRHSNLQLIDGKLYFNELLFSGLAYRFTAIGVFIDLLMIEDGIEVGKSDDLLPLEQGYIRIDIDYEDEFEDDELSEYDAQRTFWKGNYFQGGGFIFALDGILEDECIYDSGMRYCPSRSWLSSGLLSKLYKIGGERYSWYNDGSLSRYSIRSDGSPEVDYSISINESKQISMLSLGADNIFDDTILNEYGIADNLTLMGKAIRNQELFMIIQNVEKGAVKGLDISGTSITGDFLLALNFKGIQRITIGDNEFITDEDFSAFQDEYPECRVVREIY